MEMTKQMVLELLELQRKQEVYFSDAGAEEFWRLVCEIEEEEDVAKAG